MRQAFRAKSLLRCAPGGLNWLGRRDVLNTYHFHFKDECGIWSDDVARSALAISQIRRDENLPLGSYGHELQDFLETGNNIFYFKGHGFSRPRGAVKLGPVKERSLVVAQDRVGFHRLLPLTGRQNFVLQ